MTIGLGALVGHALRKKPWLLAVASGLMFGAAVRDAVKQAEGARSRKKSWLVVAASGLMLGAGLRASVE